MSVQATLQEQTFQGTVDKNGRILIPVQLRKKFGLMGKTLLISATKGGIYISTKKQKLLKAQQKFQALGIANATEDFLDFRQKERELEQKREG